MIKELARERGYAAVRQDTGFVIACQLVDVLKLLMSNPNPERAQIRRAFAGMLGVALQTVEKRHYLHVCHDTTEMTTGIATIPGTTEADLQKWFDNNVQWTKVEPRP